MMEKDVLITIGGTLTDGEGKDNVDVVSPGQYFWKNEKHFLIYEEVLEDSSGSINNMIRISPEEVSVRKKGLVNSEMIFRTDRETVTEYGTPYGVITLGIHTNRIRICETEEKISVLIDYYLTMDGRKATDNYIRLQVTPRSEGLSLR